MKTIFNNIIRRIKSYIEPIDIPCDKDEYIAEDIEDDKNGEEGLKEYIAGMSYNLLLDGSVDIRFSYNKNIELDNPNIANIVGELLFHINDGTYATQSIQSLNELSSSIEHYSFINEVMASWARLSTQIKDTPIIKPSDVGKNNLPFFNPQQIQEETQ